MRSPLVKVRGSGYGGLVVGAVVVPPSLGDWLFHSKYHLDFNATS